MSDQRKFQVIKLASFEACFRTAEELGYTAAGSLEKGAVLYNQNNSSYATITQYKGPEDLTDAWLLTEYNYEPSQADTISILSQNFGTLRTFEVWRPECKQ